MKSGNLKFLEPSGPLQACNGTALPLPLPFYPLVITFYPLSFLFSLIANCSIFVTVSRQSLIAIDLTKISTRQQHISEEQFVVAAVCLLT
jgi:hypothetical protein